MAFESPIRNAGRALHRFRVHFKDGPAHRIAGRGRALLRWLGLALLGLCTACVQAVPFALDVPASGAVSREFVVAKSQLYAARINYLYDADSAGHRQMVWDLAGGTDYGAPFDVWLRLTKLEPAEQRLYQGVTRRPRLNAWSDDALHAEVHRIKLEPGRYRFEARVVNGEMPVGTEATFSFGRAYIGK